MRIETVLHRWLDDLKIRGNIKISRRKQAVMSDVQHFIVTIEARAIRRLYGRAFGENRVSHRLEGLSYQRRANRLGRIAATERE